MGEAALKHLTVDEFLAWEGEGDTRYELYGGEIVAMTPPASFHGTIVIKAGLAVGRKLKPPCQVITEAGITLPWRNDTYYQADLAVTCSPYRRRTWATPNPILIIEVLSPSTMREDRGVKLADYRLIESVQEIVLIASEQKRVEHWRRDGSRWSVSDLEAGQNLRLDSIGIDIPIEALYEGLDFSDDPAERA